MSLVILHYTAMDGCEAALERLCDPVHEVSCHWLIAADGALWRLVPEDRRAWHAGAARWGGLTDVNSASIGIELDHRGTGLWPEVQLAALEALLGDVTARFGVSPERVLGHSDVAPGRKGDPGAGFPWARLARRGLAVWPEEVGQGDLASLPASLTRIGYDPGAPESARLAAFRLRFRPGAHGPADAADAGLAAEVARRWPCVDPGGARD